jgi:flagellar hook-associated protein 1 FlgK
MSLQLSFSIASSALQAFEKALAVTSHNIANANTPGASRQVVTLVTRMPHPVPSIMRSVEPGQLGTGVDVVDVRRVRNEMLDAQVRSETSGLGRQTALRDGLRQVEAVLADPTTGGTNNALRQFFESLHNLSNNPESSGLRTIVRQRAVTLADSFHRDHLALTDLRGAFNNQISQKVSEVNTLARQIADLNAQIFKASAADDNPNDLQDRRDQLLEDLSKLVNVTTRTDAYGRTSVYVGGIDLVRDDTVNELTTAPDALDPSVLAVQFSRDGDAAQITGGEIGGLLQVRDTNVPDALTRLDNLASELINQVNTLHNGGFTLTGAAGGDFFVAGGTAETIAVDPAILSDPSNIAASSTSGATGNGNIARALANLENQRFMDGGTTTPEAYHRTTLLQLAQAAQQADADAGNRESVLAHLSAQRQQLSGININEEFVNLLRFQRAFEASARLLNTVDSMMDLVINRMGVG